MEYNRELNWCHECGEHWDITKYDFCPVCGNPFHRLSDEADDMKYNSYSPQIDIDYDEYDHE